MTREQLISMLQEGGVEDPSKSMVRNILNAFTTEKDNAVAQATTTAEEKFKDYVKPEDHQKIINENATLKDASAKANRLAKYKEHKLLDKYAEDVDAKLKDSKDFDKDLAKYKEDYAEQFESNSQGNPQQQTQFTDMGNGTKSTTDTGPNSAWNNTFRAAITGQNK